MSYATTDDLADALRIRVIPANEAIMQACLDAAAEEIDASLDRLEPLPDPAPASVVRCNVNRAVEWFKATDAAYGNGGFDQVGLLHAPNDGFARHAASIASHKQQWSIA